MMKSKPCHCEGDSPKQSLSVRGDCFVAKNAPRNDILLILLLLFSLAACAAPKPSGAERTPTAVMAGESATPLPAELDPTPRPTIVPFQFVLPTPGAEPVSGWRPPLYPVPWAVSAYDHFYFTRPIAADNVNWPLAEYRYGGTFFAPNVVHTGVDIDAEEGTSSSCRSYQNRTA